MAELVNIHQPRYGVLREAPKARKSLLSVFDADNMMMREMGTGIRRLSTRPTLKRFIESDLGISGESISALHPVTWASSREIFSELDGGTIQTEWSDGSEDGQDIIHCVEDGRGGVYSLSYGGRIEKRNAEGEVSFAVTVPISLGMVVCPRLLVDPLGGIYAAASAPPGNGQARLYKFLPRQDSDGADLAWAFSVNGSEVADFTLRGGQVFMGLNEPGRVAKVIAIENTGEGDPYQSWEMPVPYPVACVKYGLGLIFSSKPDPDRGSGGPLGGDENVWEELDLTNAETRVHAIYDARRAGDFPDGARMNRLVEIRRQLGIDSADTTNRDLLESEWFRPASNELTVQNSGHGSPGPRFRAELADGEPAIWFNSEEGSTLSRDWYSYDKGSGLWSQQADASLQWKKDKLTDTSSLPGATGLWPHTPNQQFLVAWKLRWPKGSGTGMVWSIGGWPGHWQYPSDEANSLALIVQDDGAGSIGYLDGGIAIRGAVTGGVIATTATEVDGAWEAIVLIERRVTSGTSILRVNGTVVSSALDFFQERFTAPREIWGNRIHNEQHHYNGVSGELALGALWFAGANSYDGAIQKAVSIMAPSTGGGVYHDQNFTTAEIELIEGSMAWRRQEGDLLPVTHAYATANGYPPRGSAALLPQETATNRALRSPDGIIGLLLPGQGAFGWAVAGAGIGYDHTVDRLGNIYTTGPWLADDSIPDEAGPRCQVFRRMIDRGLSVDYLRPSMGEIKLTGQPNPGDTFVIDPGDGAVTYEFDGAGTESLTYYAVAIGADLEATMTKLVNTLTVGEGGVPTGNPGRFYARPAVNIGAGSSPVYTTLFESRETPTGVPVAITCTPASTLEIISGMDGGSNPAGTWDVRTTWDYEQEDANVRMAALTDGDLYAPWVKFGSRNEVVRLSKEDGSVVWSRQTGAATDAALAVSIDRREVNFGPSVDSTEFVWVGGELEQNVEKWRLVLRSPNTD
ncbi:MAG: hypothetical protein KDB61_05450, partial [Planctomycetes bacterium]|nr:hypothetical protein [Planctomycetota bacterium]